MDDTMRSSGIKVIGDVPWGTHFCLFYQTRQDLIDVLVPYFKAGLENNEFCMCVASEPLGKDEVKGQMAMAIPGFNEYIKNGQIEILAYDEWYEIDGIFDPDRVLNGWVEKLRKARERGYSGLRLTGNTFWLEKAGWKAFMDYEDAVSSAIGQYKIIALCTYSLDRCDAGDILDVVGNHQFALARQEGEWKIVESWGLEETKAALHKMEGQLAEGQKLTDTGSWEMNLVTGEIVFSDNMLRILRLSRGRHTYDEFQDSVHPEDRGRRDAALKAAIDSGKRYDLEYRIVLPDKSVRYIHAIGSVTMGPNGKPVRITSTIQDITERKRIEMELRKAREELEARVRERTRELERANRALKALSKCKEAMIRAEDETILLQDICNIVVDVGGYRLTWIGYVDDDELRTVRPVARAGYDEGYVDGLKIALNHPVYGSGPTGISLKSGKPYGSRNIRTDAEMKPWRAEALKRGYQSSLNLPLMCEGQILGTLVIYSGRPDAFEGEELGLLIDLADNLSFGIRAIRNRARRDLAERELLRAKEELEVRVEERTEELKSAKELAELYLDLMGHDINNMNMTAAGFLELAKDIIESGGRIDCADIDLLNQALASINNSSMLISNVRKLQQGKSSEHRPEVYDLGKLIEETAEQFETIPDRDVHITFDMMAGIRVRANELLRDVFINLIGNAVKHSSGPTSINIRLVREKEDDRQYCKVTIDDNGPGVPDDMKETIFNRLHRGDTRAKGSGLGLYLVKTLVERYGGKVWAEDRVQGDHTKGARFVVMLPIDS